MRTRKSPPKLTPGTKPGATGIESKTADVETQLDMSSLIMELVTRKMRQLLGETSTELFFAYLKRKHGLLISEIPDKPEAFTDALGEILGSSATMFESLIVKELCINLGLKYEERKGYRLIDYVREMRKSR